MQKRKEMRCSINDLKSNSIECIDEEDAGCTVQPSR